MRALSLLAVITAAASLLGASPAAACSGPADRPLIEVSFTDDGNVWAFTPAEGWIRLSLDGSHRTLFLPQNRPSWMTNHDMAWLGPAGSSLFVLTTGPVDTACMYPWYRIDHLDLRTGRRTGFTREWEPRWFQSIAISGTGQRFAAPFDGGVRWYEVSERLPAGTLTMPGLERGHWMGEQRLAAFTSTGLSIYGLDGTVLAHDADFVYGTHFAPRYRQIGVTTETSLWIYDAGEERPHLIHIELVADVRAAGGYRLDVERSARELSGQPLALSRAGDRVAVRRADEALAVIELATGRSLGFVVGQAHYDAAAFSADGATVAVLTTPFETDVEPGDEPYPLQATLEILPLDGGRRVTYGANHASRIEAEAP